LETAAPHGYWTAISDAIVHRIHHRVLAHIKREAEGATTSARARN
jgi:hypothetical protein